MEDGRGGQKVLAPPDRLVSLQSAHKLGNADLERPGKHFEIADTDFLLSVLQVRNETAVHANVLGHVDLCPALPLAESA